MVHIHIRVVTIIFLLIFTVDVRSQFYDFFQGLQPFIQPIQPTRQTQKHTNNTRRVANQRIKQNNRSDDTKRYNFDIPFSLFDDGIERGSVRKEKPLRKTTQAGVNTTDRTTKKTAKSSHRNSSNNSRNNQVISSINNNQNERLTYDEGNINFIEYTTVRTTTKNNNNYNYDNTRGANNRRENNDNYDPNNKINNNYNYDGNTRETNNRRNNDNYDQNSGRNGNNYYTTQNPYNRPGVRPTFVDTRPPITNKPVTVKPSFSIGQTDDEPAPDIRTGVDDDSMSSVEKNRYIEIAEKMCEKYKSLNMKQLQAIPLVPSPEPVKINVSSCSPTNIPLIIGGKVVSIREFPHMAMLGWTKLKGDGYSWKCGGSLISDQYVLTAAHCTYYERDNSVVPGPPRAVQLGSSYRDDPAAKVVKISSVIRHPKYKSPISYYDSAVIKLVTAVRFTDVIKPACLGEPPSIGKSVIATGWGRTEYGGDQSQELRSVSLPLWSMDECRNVLGVSRKIPDGPSRDSQICAGVRSGGKDTCQGDSGGPAQIQDGCLWRVVAVTSLGRSCGAAYTPGVYSVIDRAFVAAEVFGNSYRNDNSYNSNNYNNNNYDKRATNPRDSSYDNNYSNSRQNTNNYDNTASNRRDRNYENTYSDSRQNTDNYNYNTASNRRDNNYDSSQNDNTASNQRGSNYNNNYRNSNYKSTERSDNSNNRQGSVNNNYDVINNYNNRNIDNNYRTDGYNNYNQGSDNYNSRSNNNNGQYSNNDRVLWSR